MGMCQEQAFYHLQILKEVPGQNRFVEAKRIRTEYNTTDVRMPQQAFTLAELCNNDKNARIRFALETRSGVDIHVATTTIGELESGKLTLEAGNGCTLVFQEF